jgi:sulfoxide reductase heme-binding subunit YedZ
MPEAAAARLPWRRRDGQFSPLKATVLALLCLPGSWLAFAGAFGLLGARPFDEAIHQSGLWTIRLIFLALAVTPLREIWRSPDLGLARRMVGLAAFLYALLHLGLYAADQAFDFGRVASEIALRFYLTIGFAALCGLTVLAATSTDAAIRRMGPRRWRRLHRCVYGVAVLAIIHYWLQSKLDLWEPTIMAGLLFWLLAYRVMARARRPGPLAIGALGLAAALAVALAEAAYFHLAFGAEPGRIIAADLSFAAGVRPAPVVLAMGLVVAVGAALRGHGQPNPVRRRPGRGIPALPSA